MQRLCLAFLCLGVGFCSQSDVGDFTSLLLPCQGCVIGFLFEGLWRIPIASGIAQQLKEIFPGEPMMAVEKAAADGLTRALGDEGIGLSEVVCNRDYAKLCPQGRQYL